MGAVQWDSQTEAKRFWFTLLKVAHVNDKPKTLIWSFCITRDVYASSVTQGNGLDYELKRLYKHETFFDTRF